MYRLLFVDIHAPNELKLKLADFPMIIKNAVISRKDLSCYTLKIAEEQEFKKAMPVSHQQLLWQKHPHQLRNGKILFKRGFGDY